MSSVISAAVKSEDNLIYLIKNGYVSQANFNHYYKIEYLAVFIKYSTFVNPQAFRITVDAPLALLRSCVHHLSQQEFDLYSDMKMSFTDIIFSDNLYRSPTLLDYKDLTIENIDANQLGLLGHTQAVRVYMTTFYPTLNAPTISRKDNILSLLHGAAEGGNLHLYRMLHKEFPHTFFHALTQASKKKDIFIKAEFKGFSIAFEKYNWGLCDFILDQIGISYTVYELLQFSQNSLVRMTYLAVKYPDKIRFNASQSHLFHKYPEMAKKIDPKCLIPKEDIRVPKKVQYEFRKSS